MAAGLQAETWPGGVKLQLQTTPGCSAGPGLENEQSCVSASSELNGNVERRSGEPQRLLAYEQERPSCVHVLTEQQRRT